MAAYSDNYTSRRRTRVYQPPQSTQVLKHETIGQTQAIPPKKKLFDGVSVAQIIAGAAAAATSVALASYIGIAGSIIGAAVSSVVTVVSSQIYRRFLDVSARKLKDAGAIAQASMRTSQSDDQASPSQGVRGARIAPANLRERAAAERSATQKKVVAFSILAAVVAVAACAAAIWFGTSGEGIGEKAAPLIPTTTQPVDTGTQQTVDDGGAQLPATTEDDADAVQPDTATSPADDTTQTEPETPQDQQTTDATTPPADTAGNTSSDTTGSGTSSSSSSTGTDTSTGNPTTTPSSGTDAPSTAASSAN